MTTSREIYHEESQDCSTMCLGLVSSLRDASKEANPEKNGLEKDGLDSDGLE